MNNKYFNFKTCWKIFVGLALFKFYYHSGLIITNIVVKILFEISMAIGAITIIHEDVKNVKLKDIVLKTLYVTIGINMIYVLLFGYSKFISIPTEEHCVPVIDYNTSTSTSRVSLTNDCFKIEFNGLEKNIRCSSKEIENFIDEYGKDFQDSVQMQLKVKKVLPGVYGLDSYKIVKKTPQEP
ncbi:MAG: hypothetical protein IKJ67_09515 [Bacteroidales bacterium]|nr:hypothetical protein [Bacteroidales bacterium]